MKDVVGDVLGKWSLSKPLLWIWILVVGLSYRCKRSGDEDLPQTFRCLIAQGSLVSSAASVDPSRLTTVEAGRNILTVFFGFTAGGEGA